jgi:hypothetical protein
MILKNIDDIIGFLSANRFIDFNTIDEICKGALGKGFMPFNVGESRTIEHYIYWLNIYQDRQRKGLELAIWIDQEIPFNLKLIYSGE